MKLVLACLIGIPLGVAMTALYSIGILMAGEAVVEMLR